MSSLVFEIPFQEEDGTESLILRLFHNKEWLAAEPDLVKHEEASLLEAVGIPLSSPEILAIDETGEECGMPAVLMTKLEGEVVLQPVEMKTWLNGMAEALVNIHHHQTSDFNYEYFSYNDTLRLGKPLWSSIPNQWVRAFNIVAGVRPESKQGFIHRDYHPTNILWQNDTVSGVVDWVNACHGPLGIDIGHCRLNLTQLHGLSAADEFLDAYSKYAGSDFDYDPYWDLLSLTDILDGHPTVYGGWTGLGMVGLSDELIRHRLDEYLVSLLERYDG